MAHRPKRHQSRRWKEIRHGFIELPLRLLRTRPTATPLRLAHRRVQKHRPSTIPRLDHSLGRAGRVRRGSTCTLQRLAAAQALDVVVFGCIGGDSAKVCRRSCVYGEEDLEGIGRPIMVLVDVDAICKCETKVLG
jgi:hypothetical protein